MQNGVPTDEKSSSGHTCAEMTKNDATRYLAHHFSWKDKPLAFEQQDRNKMCKEWASRGECNKNAAYMHEFCPVSCGIEFKDEM